MGSHAWTLTRNQKHTDSVRPDGVECSVQPYDSEEMPALFRDVISDATCTMSVFTQSLSLSSTADVLGSSGSHLTDIKHLFIYCPFHYLIIYQKAAY